MSTKNRISVSISDDIDEEVVKDDQSPGPTPDVEEMTLDTRWEQQLLGGGTDTDSNDRKGKRMSALIRDSIEHAGIGDSDVGSVDKTTFRGRLFYVLNDPTSSPVAWVVHVFLVSSSYSLTRGSNSRTAL